MLYVLDEPSIGLHPANVDGLIKVLRKLVDQGNSLVVVDHNVDIICAADEIIEIGPGSGKPADLIKKPESLTVKYLADYWKQFK